MSAQKTRPSIILGSRNPKKIREITQLMASYGIEIVGIADFSAVKEVIEDGDTFSANAAKKASEPARQLGRWVLAEDSGIMVDALNGRPGVYSARYSGADATDDSNNAKLIAELDGVVNERRGAQYVCHIAISDPDGNIRLSVEATCRGRITHQARGTNGFGYDPFFLILEYHRTFGELSPAVKQQLSHRARAFQRLIGQLVQLFRREGLLGSDGNSDR
jgi:XTP/dITP diphosphohydrolase